jgi:uncharacterized membrane protein
MSDSTGNARLEAFCDGVFAIALTLLIIDIKVPSADQVTSTAALWRALGLLAPSVFAFILSFLVILITWVNHHAALKLVTRSCASFMYANGLLLLSVVFMPFPTALLAEYLFTDHAAPGVVLYNAVTVVQAIGWILVSRTAVQNQLTRGESARATMVENGRNGYYAVGLYSALAVAAVWFPLPVAVVTTLCWIFWLVRGVRMKDAWSA